MQMTTQQKIRFWLWTYPLYWITDNLKRLTPQPFLISVIRDTGYGYYVYQVEQYQQCIPPQSSPKDRVTITYVSVFREIEVVLSAMRLEEYVDFFKSDGIVDIKSMYKFILTCYRKGWL